MKVLFILHRTDLSPTVHDFQFMAQTHAEVSGNWYTTSDLKLARRFSTEIKALAFLRQTSPSNSFAKFRMTNPTIGCYKLLVLDLAEARSKVTRLRSLPSSEISSLGSLFYISTLEGSPGRTKPSPEGC